MHLSIKKQKNNTKSNDILPFLYDACIIFERESMCSFKNGTHVWVHKSHMTRRMSHNCVRCNM